MNKDIVNLESLRKNKISLYNHTREIIDEKTGEVTASVHSFTKQAKTKDNFVKLYIENIDFLQTLGGSEMKILFFAIKNLNYTNSFAFSKNFISYFTENKILGKTAVYRNFNLLVDKKVFIKSNAEIRKEIGLYGDDIFFINPNIVGKGSFLNLEKLKRTIVQTFDFKNFKMTEEISTESQYEGFDKVLNEPQKYEVDSISQKK